MGLTESDFAIHLRPQSFIRYASGSIVGRIWLTIDEWSFPSREWDDFPVVIVGWWLEGAMAALAARREEFQCHFMDGPYWYTLSSQDNNDLELRFFESSTTGDQCLRQAHCPVLTFASAVLSAAKIVSDTCFVNEWTSSDVTTLATRYTELEKSIQKYGGR